MLDPKCLKEDHAFYYSSEGYILPCCFTDCTEKESEIQELIKDKFKLENIDKIEDVLNSDEWVNFFNLLSNEPNKSPKICQNYCKKGYVDKSW